MMGVTARGSETGMAAITTPVWTPTKDEVKRIVAELRPVIDECVARANRLLAAGSPPQPR
jgi:hypothetical protein